MRDSRSEQIGRFDWEHHGKRHYFKIVLPSAERTFSYSAAELQAFLRQHCNGKVIRKLLISYHSCSDLRHGDENTLYFYYVGGDILLIFEDAAFGFCIHGTGLVECWQYKNFDMRLLEPQYGYLPTDRNEEQYYYDLSHELQLPYENATVDSCDVDSTDAWAFSLQSFDKNKVSAPTELPNVLHFKLENGTEIKLAADDIEYFNLCLNKWNVPEKE